MSRQHSSPYLVQGRTSTKLEPATAGFDEAWLQQFIFDHPSSVPIGEIEPAFGPLVPVACELPTSAGPIDLVFMNPLGMLTLVECKLWRNPEARRKVVAQALDYAKDLCTWDYSRLEAAVGNSLIVGGAPGASLFTRVVGTGSAETVARGDGPVPDTTVDESDALVERDFADRVTNNLLRGRFLILLVGDGIRLNVEQIASYLFDHAHLNFGLALVEYGVYRLPVSDPLVGGATGGAIAEPVYLVQPRIVARTVDVEKASVRIQDGRIVVEPLRADAPKRRTRISEDVFFDEVEVEPSVKADLRAFLERIEEVGLTVDPGANTLILKSPSLGTNFGSFHVHGTFYNSSIYVYAENLGHPEIALYYFEQLAALLDGEVVCRHGNRFWWGVMMSSNGEKRHARIDEVLAVQGPWLTLIQTTLARFAEVEDS